MLNVQLYIVQAVTR